MAALYLLVTLVLLTTLAACGSTPTAMAEAKAVPPSRVLAALPARSEQPATLTVIRDSGLQGIEHVFEFWVNGMHIANLRTGEFHTLKVDPGTVFLEVRMFNVIGSVAPIQVETVFESSNRYVYRAGIDGQVKLHLRRELNLSQ